MAINIDPSVKFYGPKLKIERAKQHINDLKRQIREFAERKPYVVVVEKDADPKRCNMTIRVRQQMPPEIALTTGDAIHNLRSPLDLLAGDLVRLAGKNGDNARFPFATDATHLESRIKDTEIDKAGKHVVDEIRRLEPYPGGKGAPLRAIHDLDITDKHVAMLDVMSMGLMPDVRSAQLSTYGVRMGIRDGAIFMACPLPSNLKFGDEFQLAFYVMFSQGMPVVERESVIPAFKQLVQIIESVVTGFEKVTI